MKKTIKKYMKAYPDASVEFIVQGLLGKKKLQEERKKKAEDEANNEAEGDRIEGTSRRAKKEQGKIPDAKDMTDKEFEKLDRDVMAGKYLPK